MSAKAQMRGDVGQLMGTGRDGDVNRQKVKFTDDRVCKAHLLGCCPHDILAGSKMDVGGCKKLHDVALRADYLIASKTKDYLFEKEAMSALEEFLSECDRKAEQDKEKLVLVQKSFSTEIIAKVEKVQMLNEDIGKLLARAELLGSSGILDQSQRVLEEVERLTQLKKESEEEYRNNIPTCSLQQQKLRVCDVCGAYLGLQEKDKRLADHFRGRLHMGFMEIRSKLQQIKKTLSQKLGTSETETSRQREERKPERRLSERRLEHAPRPRDMKRTSSLSHEGKWSAPSRFREFRDRPFYQRPPGSVPLPPPPQYDRAWSRYLEPQPPFFRGRDPQTLYDPYDMYERNLRRQHLLEERRDRFSREGVHPFRIHPAF
ncbi:putative RNA-binding protein Luc7-like 1 [Hypanus sabinus]|uniref:putative RNA-binding protein Luc7-like 1 n=1 Tax=Hypanus sabinus TaxID=79690 RepID=UPI0028C44E0E|nr:putative RNA-binding protein Luc7-like 1 [Hypanus sabinus]